MSAALPTTAFTAAKSDLSGVMNRVVRDHQPNVIKRGSKERMLLLDEDTARQVLGSFRFDTVVASDPGEVTVHVRDLDVLGSGATLDDAIDEAVLHLRSYAERFFARQAFYAHTDRARHLPWLLRFALTPEAMQRDLLMEPPAQR